MKTLIMLFSLGIIIAVQCTACVSKSSTIVNNIALSKISNVVETYGVWDRSGQYNRSEYPFLKGIAISTKWKDFEPQKDQYQWGIIDEMLKKALAAGQFVYFQLGIGPESPRWVYDNGVPLVVLKPYVQANGNEDKWNSYPYYLSSTYQQFLDKTITAIADHIYDLDDKYFNRIVFIQVATGCTGDECAYKGVPVESKYQISKEQWLDYRLKVFDLFRKNFQRNRRSFYLLFNCFEETEYPREFNWVVNNINNIGRKGSVLPRGYHLTKMGSIIRQLKPYTVAPKGQFMLTRAEMDQTWHKEYFMLNLPMNIYWSVLNALHGGLGIWDVSGGILDEAQNPDLKKIIPCFEFFNKYAGNVFPEKAKGAFIAFHKGLDASDTVSYPEDKFGSANQNNKERYLAICEKYKEFGAQMDDIEAATYGQVKQRAAQKGFNDCGWDIPSGNFERFITQIDPDKTDQALWRVDGPLTPTSPIYSRFARSFSHKNNKDAIYLDVDNTFYNLKKDAKPEPLSVRIVYYDKGKGSFSVIYDSKNNPEKTAIQITKGNSGQWKEKTIIIKDAAFNNRGKNSSDISLINTDDEDDIFHMVEICRIK